MEDKHKRCSRVHRFQRKGHREKMSNSQDQYPLHCEIFKKEGASNDDPLRPLKHFLCQDDAEILDLGSVYTIKCVYDSIKLLKRRKINYWDL